MQLDKQQNTSDVTKNQTPISSNTPPATPNNKPMLFKKLVSAVIHIVVFAVVAAALAYAREPRNFSWVSASGWIEIINAEPAVILVCLFVIFGLLSFYIQYWYAYPIAALLVMSSISNSDWSEYFSNDRASKIGIFASILIVFLLCYLLINVLSRLNPSKRNMTMLVLGAAFASGTLTSLFINRTYSYYSSTSDKVFLPVAENAQFFGVSEKFDKGSKYMTAGIEYENIRYPEPPAFSPYGDSIRIESIKSGDTADMETRCTRLMGKSGARKQTGEIVYIESSYDETHNYNLGVDRPAPIGYKGYKYCYVLGSHVYMIKRHDALDEKVQKYPIEYLLKNLQPFDVDEILFHQRMQIGINVTYSRKAV